MLSHESQTEFSVSQWLFVLQMENYKFTNTHIFVKTNAQVTKRKFVFVDGKTRVQLMAYL